MALGAMRPIRDEGPSIPDDIAPINQFQYMLGSVAAEMVLERLNELGPDMPGGRREIPYELVRMSGLKGSLTEVQRTEA
jgi:DNA-binding LacI/PurR family transcriptional regulator